MVLVMIVAYLLMWVNKLSNHLETLSSMVIELTESFEEGYKHVIKEEELRKSITKTILSDVREMKSMLGRKGVSASDQPSK